MRDHLYNCVIFHHISVSHLVRILLFFLWHSDLLKELAQFLVESSRLFVDDFNLLLVAANALVNHTDCLLHLLLRVSPLRRIISSAITIVVPVHAGSQHDGIIPELPMVPAEVAQ